MQRREGIGIARPFLEMLEAERIVVGHTPTPEALVLSRMDDGILRVDTGMLESYYGGRASALIIENGSLEVVYENEPTSSTPTTSTSSPQPAAR